MDTMTSIVIALVVLMMMQSSKKPEKFAKKKNCPKIVTKSIEKLKKYEEQLKDVNKKMREFHANSEPRNFKEAKKELTQLRRKSWTARSRVRRQRMKISGIPIIPLFIPKIVKIRKVCG